jgi:hypothetical protein
MAIIPRNSGRYGREQMQPTHHRRDRPRYRWWILEIVFACILTSWAIHSVEPAFTWNDVLDFFGVVHRREFSMLAVLCLLVIGFLLIKRIFRKR